MKKFRNKKAQEEMVGFVLIIVIVAVIVLIFLGFSLKQDNEMFLDSKETGNFVNSMLQYTTSCKDNYDYFSVSELIKECYDNQKCLDGRDTCEVLETTIENLVVSSWGGKNEVKGYEINISSDKELIYVLEGNKTRKYKGAIEDLGSRGIQVVFSAYY